MIFNFTISKEDGYWVTQCLEYDYGSQSKGSGFQAIFEFVRVTLGRIEFGKKLNVNPFDLPAPPKRKLNVYTSE